MEFQYNITNVNWISKEGIKILVLILGSFCMDCHAIWFEEHSIKTFLKYQYNFQGIPR